MNAFLWAAAAMLVAVLLPGRARPRGSPGARLAARSTASPLVTLTLLLVAAGSGQSSYYDVAIVSAALSFASGLVYAHFLERWV